MQHNIFKKEVENNYYYYFYLKQDDNLGYIRVQNFKDSWKINKNVTYGIWNIIEKSSKNIDGSLIEEPSKKEFIRACFLAKNL